MAAIDTRALDRELKKGSAELLILSLLEARPRHGYELSKLIHSRSDGKLTFHIDSLYPLLYRLEERAWIKGTWIEKAGQRRRRFYRVTAEGRRVLARQRETWAVFVEAVRRVTGGEHVVLRGMGVLRRRLGDIGRYHSHRARRISQPQCRSSTYLVQRFW
jgi:transcriptional regulator